MSIVTTETPPKLFISYSWTTPDHEAWVLQLATELRESGVDVILDKWDLKEGHDGHAFMEQMVTNPEIKKVILICDKGYVDKADDRTGGVGTETQIITPEIYNQQEQDKFVAVVAERDENGEAYIPAFYGSRIFIDLSAPRSTRKISINSSAGRSINLCTKSRRLAKNQLSSQTRVARWRWRLHPDLDVRQMRCGIIVTMRWQRQLNILRFCQRDSKTFVSSRAQTTRSTIWLFKASSHSCPIETRLLRYFSYSRVIRTRPRRPKSFTGF